MSRNRTSETILHVNIFLMLQSLTTGANKYRNLRLFNIAMGFFHLIQAVIMFTLSNDYSVTLTTNFIKSSGSPQTGNFLFFSVKENLVELQVGPAVAIFLLISAVAHFLISSPRIFEWYKGNLENGVNYARWMEYALSSSWMIVIIGVLVGIFDAPSLVLLFSLNAMMILFGWMMELHNQSATKTDWTAFIFGSIAGLVPWIIIGWYFFAAVQGYDPGENGNPIPGFVYAILVSLFVFFNIFAINMILQYRKVGPWKNYLFGEATYIVLSLVAKSALAWQVWGGTLRGG